MAKKPGPKPKVDAIPIGMDWLHQLRGKEFKARKTQRCRECGHPSKVNKSGFCYQCTLELAKENHARLTR